MLFAGQIKNMVSLALEGTVGSLNEFFAGQDEEFRLHLIRKVPEIIKLLTSQNKKWVKRTLGYQRVQDLMTLGYFDEGAQVNPEDIFPYLV